MQKHITVVALATLLSAPPVSASREQAVTALAEGLGHLSADPDGVGLAACVARSDRVLLLQTQGQRRLGSRDAVDDDTRFRIASLSKGFAATVTAQLVGEGRLTWSEPVRPYVPELVFKNPGESDRIRLEYLLSHRLGLPPNAYDNVLEAGRPVSTIIPKFREVDPICAVGTCYGYQNVAYNLVTDVIETRTGVDYERQVRQRLFEPLGMRESGFGRASLEATSNWARPHVGRGARLRTATVREPYYRLPASAGINASIGDLCTWLQAQLGAHEGVLGEGVRELLWQPRVETRQEMRRGRWRRVRLDAAHYGLGWRIYDYAGERVIFHAGSVQGYGAQIAIVPRLDIGVVAVWNSQSRRPWGIAATFLDALLGLKPEDWLRLEEMRATPTASATP